MREVWKDSEGKTVYIKGVPEKVRGGLSNVEWNEAKDMKTGSVTKNGIKYLPPFHKTIEETKTMNFDDTVNEILNEKFGTPGKARARKALGTKLTSRDPNAWKDPLKKHHMKTTRGQDRKNLRWVPKTHQTDVPLAAGQRILDLAKDADEGIWEISLAQAIPIAKKYKMHIPRPEKPVKHLGSTGIVMYLRWDNYERRYRLFLVKHDRIVRKGVKLGKEKKTPKPFKGSFKSKYKAKKPKKAIEPLFGKGKKRRISKTI